MTEKSDHGVVGQIMAAVAGSSPLRGSRVVLFQLGVGAACLLLGAFPILAGLGLVETEGGIEPLGRLVAILFGGVFVSIGAVLVGHPLVARARAHGAGTRRDALRLGLTRLRHRPTAGSAVAALWMAPLAAAYGATAAGMTLPWLGDADGLRAILLIEFLVIHGFPFLVVAAVFMRGARGAGRVVAGAALGLLLALYGVFAWVMAGGVAGVAALFYLVSPNVLAFAGAGQSGSARVLVTSRWVIKFMLFMLTAGVLGGGETFDGPGAILVGAVYFTLLAAVEVFRIVEIPRELAAGS